MLIHKLALIVVALVLLSASVISAQDTPSYSLRGLAPEGFHIGAAVSIPSLKNDETYAATLAREFNMVTPENVMKMETIQPQRGTFSFTQGDALVNFAEANGMAVHGHTLVWHNQLPSWFVNGTFSRDEAIQLLRDHIYTVVGHYKGRIAYWDVVNEAVADDGSGLRDAPWRQFIGDDYIDLAFQFAHEADPDAVLFYNDYGAEGMGAKANAVYNMVKDMIDRGIPIGGVGLQAHSIIGTLNFNAIGNNIQRLGDLGLQVQITEFDDRYDGEADADVLRQQAADYHQMLQTCLDHPACTAFVTWGVYDKTSWLRGSNLGFFSNPTVEPLLFDDNFQPKPAYFAMMDVLARNAGVTSLMTDEQVDTMLGRAPTEPAAVAAPTKSDPAQLAPDAVPGQIYYAPFPVSITLDGDTSDWENVPRVTVNTGTTPDGTTSFEFAAAADDTNFYFLADVTDAHVTYGTFDPAASWYQEDSVEFYINATGDLQASAYADGIAQIGITADNIDNTDPDHPLIGGGNSASTGVKAVVVKTDKGYRVEASVPLVSDFWTITPEQGAVIGFQVHLNGASDDSGRDAKLIWSAADTNDQSYSNPSLFGQLIFWAAGS